MGCLWLDLSFSLGWDGTFVKWDLNLPLPQLMVSARVQKAQRDSTAVIALYVPRAICSLHLASSLSDTAVTVTPPAGTLELGPWGQECPWGKSSTESLN